MMNQRVRLTKQILRENLFLLLKTKPVDEISITQLCETAEINRSTFYAHYTSVRDVMAEYEKEIIADIKAICGAGGSIRDKTIRICEYLYNHKETELILFQNSSENDLSRMFNIINQELRELRNKGKNTVLSSTTEETLAMSFINYGMYHLVKTWLVENIQMTPTEVSALMLDCVLRIEADE